jgi:hypothetical protein
VTQGAAAGWANDEDGWADDTADHVDIDDGADDGPAARDDDAGGDDDGDNGDDEWGESESVQGGAIPVAAATQAVPVQADDESGTGHPAVDEAVRAVANAATLPMGEQLAAYEGAHETLREVLASIED